MYEVIMNLEADVTNGNQNYCLISEEKLNAMKALVKKEKENYNKKLEENTMLKSDNNSLKTKFKENDKRYLKVIEEKNKEIRNLKERISSLESKQVDIFDNL